MPQTPLCDPRRNRLALLRGNGEPAGRSFLGGFQLIVLGVMSEYIGLIFDEVKNRPIYVIQERYGFERDR